MSLKKILIRCDGQILVEYFIIVTLLLALALASFSGFYKRVQQQTEGFTNFCVNRMVPGTPYD